MLVGGLFIDKLLHLDSVPAPKQVDAELPSEKVAGNGLPLRFEVFMFRTFDAHWNQVPPPLLLIWRLAGPLLPTLKIVPEGLISPWGHGVTGLLQRTVPADAVEAKAVTAPRAATSATTRIVLRFT
jgi:hypothetical protein